MRRKTKIICTIGPACSGVENLCALIEAGMDVARLNFSHGSHEEHLSRIREIREASERTGKLVAILQDLQGPKIRIGALCDGSAQLIDGAQFVITADEIECGNAERAGTTYANLINDVQPGSVLLLDDGYIILTVKSVEGNEIITHVEKGGVLKSHKGIIAPGAVITAPALSEKDIDDLKFGLAHGVDMVALSFVSSERDLIELRTTMKLYGRVVPIIAKIERYEGISDIEDIIHEADAIMVARGDLGVEMKPEDVPVLQKHIINRCNYYGKPVITATQMLESMIDNPRPTRAEASDVANAVIDGTDCVMLSAETSVGHYPIEAVLTMHNIICRTEENVPSIGHEHEVPRDMTHNVADAVGRACCVIAEQIGAAAIVPLTTSGGTAKIIAKYRPAKPILALTDNEETVRRLALVWGIYPKLIPPIVDSDELLGGIAECIIESGFAQKGDYVILSAGAPLRKRVSTNMLKVQKL